MAKVLIEGVISTDALRRGERAEVQRTERVDRLIEFGYVREVDDSADQAVSGPAAAEGEGIVPEVQEEPQPVSGPAATEVAPPARNASRDDWATFLDGQSIAYPEDAGRDDLRAIWDGQE